MRKKARKKKKSELSLDSNDETIEHVAVLRSERSDWLTDIVATGRARGGRGDVGNEARERREGGGEVGEAWKRLDSVVCPFGRRKVRGKNMGWNGLRGSGG